MPQEIDTRTHMGALLIAGKLFPLFKGINLIGRSRAATVSLKNENVSQHQAIITIIDEDQHFLSDVKSCNGTILDNNILVPLDVYPLEEDNVIEFANVVGVYKKAPLDVSNVSTLTTIENGNLQSTQNVEDSFYVANTQNFDLPVVPILETHQNGCFDDGYDFNNLPSPPNTTVITPKKDFSIHDMPTQILGEVNAKNTENEFEFSNRCNPAIHDLPTQLMFEDVGTSVCNSANEEIARNESPQPIVFDSPSIHFKPTQILNLKQNAHLDDTLVPQTQDSPVPNLRGPSDNFHTSVDVIDQSAMNDSGIYASSSKAPFQNKKSLTLVEGTPCKKEFGKCLTLNNLKHDENSHKDETSQKDDENRPSKDIGQHSETDLSIQQQSSTLRTSTPSQEIGYKNKTLSVIESDSGTDLEDEGIRTKSFQKILTGKCDTHSDTKIDGEGGNAKDENDRFNKCIAKLDLENHSVENFQGSSKVDSEMDVDENIADINQSAMNDSGIYAGTSKAPFQNKKSLTLVEGTLCKKQFGKSLTLNSPKHDENSPKDNENRSSEEIGQHKRMCLSIDTDSEPDLNIQQQSSASRASSPSQEIGYKKKTLRVIKSDSDTDIEDEDIQIKAFHKISLTGKCGTYSDSRIEDENDKFNKCITKLGLRNHAVEKFQGSSKIDSDSETDIDESIADINNASDSEADAQSERANNKHLNGNSVSKDTDIKKCNTTDIYPTDKSCLGINESVFKRFNNDDDFISAMQCSDDDDSDDFNFMPENSSSHNGDSKTDSHHIEIGVFDASQKLYELRQSTTLQQDSTEDSIHFGLTDMDNTEDSSNITNETAVSNKKTSLEAAVGKGSIITANNQVSISKSNTEKVNELPHNSKSDINKPGMDISGQKGEVVCPSVTLTGNGTHNKVLEQNYENDRDNSFVQPTQNLITGNDLVDQDEDIFNQPTQISHYSQSEKSNVVADNICKQSSQKNCKRGETYSMSTCVDPDEDIFLQPTQVLVVQTSVNSNSSNDKNVFLKPESFHKGISTNKAFRNINEIYIESHELLSQKTDKDTDEDDIFLQPTQEIRLSKVNDHTNKGKEELCHVLQRQNLIINQRIFINPNQPIVPNQASTETSVGEQVEDIFLQATQILSTDKCLEAQKSFKEPKKHTFGEENIFDQANQVFPVIEASDYKINIASTTKTKANNLEKDYVFLQSTQSIDSVVTDNCVKSSLSLLHQLADEVSIDDSESQLEVTFPSQTVKLCSQVNTRPLNPLANVLGKSLQEEYEQSPVISEDSESSSDSVNVKLCNERNVLAVQSVGNFKITGKSTSKPQNQSLKLKNLSKSASNVTPANINLQNNHSRRTRQTKNNASTVNTAKEDANLEVSGDNQTLQGIEDETPQLRQDTLNEKWNKLMKKTSYTDIHKATTSISSSNSQSGSRNSNDEVPKQTRTVRTRSKKVDNSVLQRTVNNIQIQNSTRAKKATKNKLNIINDDSGVSESKRGKFEGVPETPKVNSNLDRRGRKLMLDQQQNLETKIVDFTHNQAAEASNKHKPPSRKASETSVITICSTDSMDSKDAHETHTLTKRRKKDNTKANPLLIPHITSPARTSKKNQAQHNGGNRTHVLPAKKQTSFDSPENSSSLRALNISDRTKRQQKPKVVFTMLDSPELESLIRSLGGSVVETVTACTVLVTGNVKRSLKLLSAVGEAKPICGPNWLHASKKAGAFLDPWNSLLIDNEAETKWKFSLKQSLDRSNNRKLLAEYSFHILTNTSTDVLKAAIESCGGKLLVRVPTKASDTFIIIGAPENRKKYLKFLQKQPPFKVVAPEAIFDGVLRQELHWDDHLLS